MIKHRGHKSRESTCLVGLASFSGEAAQRQSPLSGPRAPCRTLCLRGFLLRGTQALQWMPLFSGGRPGGQRPRDSPVLEAAGWGRGLVGKTPGGGRGEVQDWI